MEKLAEFAAWAGRTLGHGPAIILFVVTMTAGPKVIEWLFEKASNTAKPVQDAIQQPQALDEVARRRLQQPSAPPPQWTATPTPTPTATPTPIATAVPTRPPFYVIKYFHKTPTGQTHSTRYRTMPVGDFQNLVRSLPQSGNALGPDVVDRYYGRVSEQMTTDGQLEAFERANGVKIERSWQQRR
ncbi:MAG: hypothetical protein K0S03_2335 [Burkholderiales bacterium]|jgi:hypothetical protein|nr:hypothetical protein [Burkholderiales bacterium]